uniref:MARVEL domain-containing protein n=1 Tax=Caenorhabditis tropicalis TaxID=1561998 RepID=A0A1I7U1V6_9PELO
MMRFMNDYEKMNNDRDMEFSLLFFLTLEVVITVTGYYTMELTGLFNNNVTEWFYSMWILNILAATILFMYTNGSNFVVYRVGFRMIHMIAIVYVFCVYGEMAVSVGVIAFCSLELFVLIAGVSTGEMAYPGKWISGVMWQETVQPIETARSSYPVYSLEMDLSNTVNDDFSDDLFDYYTAFEDEISADESKPKHRGTYIV